MNYTIQPGDTLTRLARRFSTSVTALMGMNNIDNPDVIEAGATLLVPDGPGSAPVTVDQNGSAVNLPVATSAAPMPALGLNLADWLKPPKLYFLLGALALGSYLFTKRGRK